MGKLDLSSSRRQYASNQQPSSLSSNNDGIWRWEQVPQSIPLEFKMLQLTIFIIFRNQMMVPNLLFSSLSKNNYTALSGCGELRNRSGRIYLDTKNLSKQAEFRVG